MKMLSGSFLLLLLLLTISMVPAAAQSDESAETRKLVSKVAPDYPQLARKLRLSGTVKFEVLVATNGAVKSVRVKGGNPVLVESAENALREWRWEKSERDSTEVVEIKFGP